MASVFEKTVSGRDFLRGNLLTVRLETVSSLDEELFKEYTGCKSEKTTFMKGNHCGH